MFGIDYDAAEWNARIRERMVPDLVITTGFVLLLLAALNAWTQQATLKRLSKKLAYDEALYRNVFSQAPIGIAIVNDKNFVFQSDSPSMSMNPMFEQILGRKADQLVSIPWPEISHPDDLSADLALFDQFRNGAIDGYSLEKRFLR
ncbi:MAG: PAS domain-containing protein, partial [Clostridiaceae bacterium]|nr:PAS domain-containing protein [Clostridiaceae bacterium]